MEKFHPERSLRRFTAPLRRAIRTHVPRETRHSIQKVARIARTGIIFLSVVGAAGAAAYDYIAHAQGQDGLTQGYVWGAMARGDCIEAGYIASHRVDPDESVFLHMRSYVGDEPAGTVTIDLSGSPLKAGRAEFCFKSGELPRARVIFQAENGGAQGQEARYEAVNP